VTARPKRRWRVLFTGNKGDVPWGLPSTRLRTGPRYRNESVRATSSPRRSLHAWLPESSSLSSWQSFSGLTMSHKAERPHLDGCPASPTVPAACVRLRCFQVMLRYPSFSSPAGLSLSPSRFSTTSSLSHASPGSLSRLSVRTTTPLRKTESNHSYHSYRTPISPKDCKDVEVFGPGYAEIHVYGAMWELF
jgi:hypothetical protein